MWTEFWTMTTSTVSLTP